MSKRYGRNQKRRHLELRKNHLELIAFHRKTVRSVARPEIIYKELADRLVGIIANKVEEIRRSKNV